MPVALVVDDDTQLARVIEKWLEAAGYTVDAVYSFHDARRVLTTSVPDVLVADIRLGDYNGLQLALLARDINPQIVIIIMSGWDDPVLRNDVAQFGGVFIGKPFTQAALLSAISQPPEENL
jgi:two-component system nitrogen regulation response regulator GlnG